MLLKIDRREGKEVVKKEVPKETQPKAKVKPIEQIEANSLGVDITNRITQLKVEEPPKRKGGVKVANVAELISKLKNEAKVI